MSNKTHTIPELPRRSVTGQSIAAPTEADFVAKFGNAFPKPRFLKSELGTTAVYDIPPPSGQVKRQVLIIHGMNTPALGMSALAKELQTLDPDAHVALYDLWGHGLSSTPLATHTPQIFHFQIFQVLAFMKWTSPHMLGFSFGGSTAVSFTLNNPWVASSVTLLAPAGTAYQAFSNEVLDFLNAPPSRDSEAAEAFLDALEGGPLVVPADWQERTRAGEFVAEAFRQWELDAHDGYRSSVLSMVRNGVFGCEDMFREFVRLSVKKKTILAELDPVCTQDQLVELGFTDVVVVKNVHHGFLRQVPGEVARIVHKFWTQ
ncbi:Alpha/Beta hydrolase protein [Xylariaceae sp. FL0255]|nr:Alpha/Beta hydrolase protein [Xylariaceae sp. FL0255]